MITIISFEYDRPRVLLSSSHSDPVMLDFVAALTTAAAS
jgi:hypothetical protein